jgi:hypothetical protein
MSKRKIEIRRKVAVSIQGPGVRPAARSAFACLTGAFSAGEPGYRYVPKREPPVAVCYWLSFTGGERVLLCAAASWEMRPSLLPSPSFSFSLHLLAWASSVGVAGQIRLSGPGEEIPAFFLLGTTTWRARPCKSHSPQGFQEV